MQMQHMQMQPEGMHQMDPQQQMEQQQQMDTPHYPDPSEMDTHHLRALLREKLAVDSGNGMGLVMPDFDSSPPPTTWPIEIPYCDPERLSHEQLLEVLKCLHPQQPDHHEMQQMQHMQMPHQENHQLDHTATDGYTNVDPRGLMGEMDPGTMSPTKRQKLD